MIMEQLTSKKKILFLCDLERYSDKMLKNSINLAKILNARIEMFYVKKVTDIAKADNQFSVMREMSHDFIDSNKFFEESLSALSDEERNLISYTIGYGNIKDEVSWHIKSFNPDVIVMGKRKRKAVSFIGDSLTEFVINNYDGEVVIAREDGRFDLDGNISLGLFNTDENSFKETIAETLIGHSKKPLKHFRSMKASTIERLEKADKTLRKVEYIFEQNATLVKNISKYVSLNKVNLLCLEKKTISRDSTLGSTMGIGNLVDNLNVSLWISSRGNNYGIQ